MSYFSRLLSALRRRVGIGTRIDPPAYPPIRELDARDSVVPPPVNPELVRESAFGDAQVDAWLADMQLAAKPTAPVIEDRKPVSLVDRVGSA